jgi:hypothetical protein
MTSRADPPLGAITYPQWLRNQIANPGMVCGPDVVDTRSWWQHLPLFNPYAGLEAQARKARKAAVSVDGPCVGHPEAEAEAG